MSHYPVTVIRKKNNKKPFEQDLAFYDENAEVAPYIYRTKTELAKEGRQHIDTTRKYDFVVPILEGKSKEEWIKLYEAGFNTTGYDTTTEKMWKYYSLLADLIRKLDAGTLTDDDCYKYEVEHYYEGSELDAEGNMLSTYNPNSKWDWWVVGGRWSGELILKEEAREKYNGQETVDEAQVKDIDWEKMNSIAPEEEEHLRKFWKYYVKEEFSGSEEELRKEIGFILYSKEYYLNRYKTEDNYIQQCTEWSTRAVLTDEGQWVEVGAMGWFGCSNETGDEANEWKNKFKERFIDPLDPDDVITIIDCHI